MDLFDATIDGYALEIETLDDRFDKAIARYEFPYRDGALLEDLGQKARVTNIRCYFWDDGAGHFTYADHVDFVNHLQSRERFELVHPQYGPMQGCVESVAVRHDDREMLAEVDITFVEDLRDRLADVEYELADVAAANETAYVESVDSLKSALARAAVDLLGAEATGFIDRELDEAQPMVEQLTGLSTAARDWVKKVDVFVAALEAELVTVANPANGITAAISFGVNLPGRVIGSLARCIERYVVMFDSLRTAPERFLQSLENAALDMEDRLGFAPQVRGVAAAHAALEAGIMFKTDEQNRQELRQAERTTAFDRAGAYVNPAPTGQVMTVGALESALASVNAMVQAAIEVDRDNAPLKEMARNLVEHVATIKLEREKMATVDMDNPLPLHLICHRYGLPYGYAPRLQSINRIPQPNFTAGRISVYVR